MKPFIYYQNNPLKYPSADDYMEFNLYRGGEVIARNSKLHEIEVLPEFSHYPVETSNGLHWACDELGIVFELSSSGNAEYRDAKKLYQEKSAELALEFQKDIESEFGVVGNQKAELLYSIAFDKGHSSGLSGVYDQYESMVALIK